MTNATLDPDGPEFRAKCLVPSLDLGPGRYLLSVSVATKADGLLDSIDGAAWFDVLWGEGYGNGEPFLPVFGPMMLRSEWCMEPIGAMALAAPDRRAVACGWHRGG
jgi:hypothetical protein